MNKGLAQCGAGVYVSPVFPLSGLVTSGDHAMLTITHNLGTPHLRVQGSLVNLQPELSYSPGDEVLYTPVNQTWFSASQMGILTGDLGIASVAYKNGTSSGTMTAAKWGLRVRIEALLP